MSQSLPKPADPSQAREVAELRAAIAALPAHVQDSVQDALFEAAVAYRHNQEVGPLVAFVNGLLLTAKLHRTPEYVKSVEDASHDDWTDTVGARDMLAHARARRARSK